MKIETKGKIETKQSKAGKEYYTAGIKVNGTWHNGTFFDKKQCETFEALEENKEIDTIELFEEEYNGKQYSKFRLISKTEARFKLLEARITKLESNSI